MVRLLTAPLARPKVSTLLYIPRRLPLTCHPMETYRIQDDASLYFVTYSVVSWLPVFVSEPACRIVTEGHSRCPKSQGMWNCRVPREHFEDEPGRNRRHYIRAFMSYTGSTRNLISKIRRQRFCKAQEHIGGVARRGLSKVIVLICPSRIRYPANY